MSEEANPLLSPYIELLSTLRTELVVSSYIPLSERLLLGIVRATRVLECAQVFRGFPSSIQLRFHTAHRDIRTNYRWEGRGGAALWSVSQLGTEDRKAGTHLTIRIGPADLPQRYEADFVVPDDQKSKACLSYAVVETYGILWRSLRFGQVITGSQMN